MKDDSHENMAAKEAEKVMRRFCRGVKVENGIGGETTSELAAASPSRSSTS